MGKTQSTADFIRQFETDDRLGKLMGARLISVNSEECITEYSASPEHFNPNGILHGGALFTVMDSSQGAFVHFWLEEKFRGAATGTATIRYQRPVTGGLIRVRTWLKARDGRKIYVNSSAQNEAGQEVASLEETWIAIFK